MNNYEKIFEMLIGAIIEDAMIDIMFEAPSKNDINSCLITEDVINDKSGPVYKLIKKKSA